MQTPISYPFVDFAIWVPGVGPSISADFLQKTQRGLGDIYGALMGRSATIEEDDFSELAWPVGQLGKLSITTNTNVPGTMKVEALDPAAQGEHGVARVTATNAAAFNFLADGARSHLGLFDWLFSAKVAVINRTRLDTVANRGWQAGLFDTNEAAGRSCRFLLGNDQANWHVLIGATLIDTGVAYTASFTDLQMSRINGAVTAYINGALVATVNHNTSMTLVRRRVGTISPAANVGDGFSADYFRAWYAR